MMQRTPLPHVDPLNSRPQLRHGPRGKGIQRACDRRLVSKHVPPPRGCQGRIWPEAGINLLEGGAIGEHTDHHIEQLLVRLMVDRLPAELDMLPEGREEISRLQKGSQCSQGSILCTRGLRTKSAQE